MNKLRDHLSLNLKEAVLPDQVSAWKRAIAFRIVMPRFVAIVYKVFVLVVFPTLKEFQIFAAGFRALM